MMVIARFLSRNVFLHGSTLEKVYINRKLDVGTREKKKNIFLVFRFDNDTRAQVWMLFSHPLSLFFFFFLFQLVMRFCFNNTQRRLFIYAYINEYSFQNQRTSLKLGSLSCQTLFKSLCHVLLFFLNEKKTT